jgi:uncharacterized protein
VERVAERASGAPVTDLRPLPGVPLEHHPLQTLRALGTTDPTRRRSLPVEITDEELVARFPGRPLDHDNKAVYRGWLEHKLLVNRCTDCGLWHQPPKPVCPRCWSTDVRPTAAAGTGTVFMFVLLHQGPPAEGIDYSTPYPVVTVELDEQEGLRFTSTVVDATNDEIRIGRRVEVHWIERAGAPMPTLRLVGEEAL